MGRKSWTNSVEYGGAIISKTWGEKTSKPNSWWVLSKSHNNDFFELQKQKSKYSGEQAPFYTKVPLPRTTWTCVDVRWRLESFLFLEILSRLDNANRKCLLRSVYLGNPVKHFIEQRCGNCFTYLSHEVSYQRVICVLFFQTAVDVADHWHHISAAKKMNHSIQNCFLKLKLQSK